MSNQEASNTATNKKVILSGMQPTGRLMIGNYAGALRNWNELQHTHDCLFCVVDMHAITVRQKPADLRRTSLDVAALYIASGIDPEKSVIFLQSHVPQHAELAWVLTCLTYMGECSRMTQFKEKSEKHSETVGLFTYPILMAADILIYQADLVPVGADQKQHLELTRNLAERFNHYYSDTFVVPDPYIPPDGHRIMSLQEPDKKMSKSDSNLKSTLFLTDEPDEIRNKIKRAVTDSGTEIRMDESRPAVSNLLTLYQIATGRPMAEIEAHFAGKNYAELKSDLADAMIALLEPVQSEYKRLMNDKTFLEQILKNGAEAARHRAQKTLRKVYKKTGFVPAFS